jgi:SAM-dependent methyltransferase
MTEQSEKIRDEVRRYYAEIAEQQPASCCEPTDCGCASDAGSELLAGIPDDVAGFSLGCGDPISAADLQPGEVVLDLGSGGGLDCFMAAKLVGSEGLVIGIDMTDAMLDRATQTAGRLGIENVEFRRGLIEDLPVEDQSVDVIISNCVINLSPDKPAVLTEAFRALRPGGRFVVSDIVTRGEMLPHFRELADSWAGCVAGAPSVKDYLATLQSAGFVNVELNSVNGQPLDAIEGGAPFSAMIKAYKPS